MLIDRLRVVTFFQEFHEALASLLEIIQRFGRWLEILDGRQNGNGCRVERSRASWLGLDIFLFCRHYDLWFGCWLSSIARRSRPVWGFSGLGCRNNCGFHDGFDNGHRFDRRCRSSDRRWFLGSRLLFQNKFDFKFSIFYGWRRSLPFH